MPRLELEVTDVLLGRLQEKADILGVEASDIAKNLISCALAPKQKPCWMDSLTTIVSRVSDIVTAASRIKSEEGEPKQA